jgi:hypothetical protein
LFACACDLLGSEQAGGGLAGGVSDRDRVVVIEWAADFCGVGGVVEKGDGWAGLGIFA